MNEEIVKHLGQRLRMPPAGSHCHWPDWCTTVNSLIHNAQHNTCVHMVVLHTHILTYVLTSRMAK